MKADIYLFIEMQRRPAAATDTDKQIIPQI